MSNNDTAMQIFDIISQIEEAIENSPRPKLGGSQNKRTVDVDELFDLLGDLKVTIPDDIRRANSIMVEANSMIENAEDHAREIVEAAEHRAEALLKDAHVKGEKMRRQAESEFEKRVNENDIYLEAQTRAKLLARKAEHNAALVFENARQYADEVLADLERFLSEYQHLVVVNREDLGAQAQSDKAPPVVERGADPRADNTAVRDRTAFVEEEEYESGSADEPEEKGSGSSLLNWFKRIGGKSELPDDDDFDDEEFLDDEESQLKPKRPGRFKSKTAEQGGEGEGA